MRAVSDPSEVELADEELSLVEMSRLLLHGSYSKQETNMRWLRYRLVEIKQAEKKKKWKKKEYQITLRLAIWALLSGLRFSTKEK
jgi:hypothetical protein